MNIYVCLTTIYDKQKSAYLTIKSILSQTLLPTKIFVNLSEESFLLDKGFKDKNITNKELNNILQHNLVEVKWVENIGAFRKILPILKDKWNEDCVIITIDDDTIYNKNLIQYLFDDYKKHNCVIGYKGFTAKFTNINNFNYNIRQSTKIKNLYNIHTGKGGVLYHPSFFYKTKNLIFNKDIFLKTQTISDDMWINLVRIYNNISAIIYDRKLQYIDLHRIDFSLSIQYNGNKKTEIFQDYLTKIRSIYPNLSLPVTDIN